MRKFLMLVILPFLAILTNVSALSVSDTLVGYGYTQEYNGVVSSRTWVTYSSNNLLKYNYDLPNSSEIDIDTFNFRFHITGNFLRGNNYILTFSWHNDSLNGFSLYYSRMIHSMLCYSTSWSSSSQSANNCFSNYNISYSTTSNIDVVNVTLSFTPINDIYGIAFINEHDNDPYSSFPSEGWEITDINYQLVSSGTSEIIENATENTENIINNQNQNTQDIINNQNNLNRACSKKIDWSNAFVIGKYLSSNGTLSDGASSFAVTDYIPVELGIKVEKVYNYWTSTCFYKQDKTFISCITNSSMVANTYLNLPLDTHYIRVSLNKTGGPILLVCQPGNQAIADIITSDDGDFDSGNCGLICKLKNLPKAFGDVLLGLFVPDEDFWSDWFGALKDYLEEKLGFLLSPFTIVYDFLDRFLSLDTGDVIISIPDISVPNFENINIISAQEFNWSELLRSKPAFLNLWNLYLDFIDVFLIINFLNLCYRKYCDIFGENSSGLQDYEFQTSENVYTYDNNTGEVLSTQLKERKTRKVKV